MGYQILDKGGKHRCALPDPELDRLGRGARVLCTDCGKVWVLSLMTPLFVKWRKER